MKFVVALLVVALGVAVQGTKPTPKKRELSSADVEALLDPEVSSLPKGQHKLVFTGANGKEQCVVCQPFQGCGCRDVVAIRCELKRLKQKLNRLKRIASPHKRSHHDRNVEDKPKKVDTPKAAVKPAVQPTPRIMIKPAVVQPTPKILIKPAVLPAFQPLVDPKPAVEPAVKAEPAAQPALVKLAVVKPAVEEKKNVA